MKTVCAKTGFVLFENFIKSSEITTDRALINVGSVFDGDVYKLFKVVEAHDWERYDRKHYKSITKFSSDSKQTGQWT